jgi:hypothetical protein
MSFHRWFAGFFLLLLMIAALIFNSIMFSARSFQENLQEVAPATGGVLSLVQLEEINAGVDTLQSEIAPLRSELGQLERREAELTRELGQMTDALSRRQFSVLENVAGLETRAGVEPADTGGVYAATDLSLRLDRLSVRVDLDDALRAQIVEARTEIASIGSEAARMSQIEADLATVVNDVRLSTEQVSRGERQILSLTGQYGNDFDRVQNEARALMASSPWHFSAKFAAMHPTFLSTILACTMGALGAILYLFPAYLNPANQITFVVIVVRMVFGMVAALAFYIVANVLGVSLAAGATSVGSLNPFMVAFLGIIAGIMADDIAKWIMERGREILGGSETPQVTLAPSEGALGAIADPFLAAARDALPDRTPPTSGNEPPRGGVQG